MATGGGTTGAASAGMTKGGGVDGGDYGIWRREHGVIDGDGRVATATVIEGPYHFAAAYHERRSRFPRSLTDGIPSPFHLVLSGAGGPPVLEYPLD